MVRERQVILSYGTARCLEAGTGWPVVLLHAFPLSADMWRPQLEAVPDGWRFLAPDLRGFGPGSTEPARSVEECAQGVLELLDALDIEITALGGLSMGGYVTFAALRLAPERFSALVFANTRASADTDEGRSGRDRMLQLVRSKGVGAVADDMLPKLLGKTTQRERPELGETVRALINKNSADAVAGAIEALRDRPDSTPLLPELSVPSLVITSDEDTLIPEAEARSMQAQLRRGRLVVLPGAGHLSNLEVPDRFSHALEDFLRAPL